MAFRTPDCTVSMLSIFFTGYHETVKKMTRCIYVHCSSIPYLRNGIPYLLAHSHVLLWAEWESDCHQLTDNANGGYAQLWLCGSVAIFSVVFFSPEIQRVWQGWGGRGRGCVFDSPLSVGVGVR